MPDSAPLITKSNMHGVLWMVLSCLMASIMISMIRHISESTNIFMIVFYRNLFATILFLPWVLKNLNLAKTKKIKLYLMRSSTGITAMLMWFYAISVISLPIATSLSFAVPLITALLSIFFFKEKYGIHRWAAMIIGFIGVLIVLRPGSEIFDPTMILILISTIFWATSSIVIKYLTRTDHPYTIAFISTLLMLIFSIPFAIYQWQMPSFEMMMWLLGLGVISNIFQVALTKAFTHSDFAVVMPFDYTRLIFISIIAYFVFDEVLDFWTLIGSAVIMASSAYSAWRTRLRSKKLVQSSIG